MATKETSSKTADTSTQDNGEFRHIVRIANTDLKGEKPLYLALQKITGVGENFARIICKVSDFDSMTQTGSLSEKQAKQIENVLQNPAKFDIPAWTYNVQKSYETGEDAHLLHSDLHYKQDNDIKRKKKMKSFQGLRHQWRLPLRGQRTRSHFRPNAGKGSAVKKKTTIRK
ncbi:MAG: 30S ribosomal protein S13 [Nanobdellota archaeon]